MELFQPYQLHNAIDVTFLEGPEEEAKQEDASFPWHFP